MKKKIGIIVLVLVVIIALLGMCGGNDSDTSTTSDQEQKTEQKSEEKQAVEEKASPEDNMTTAQKNAYKAAQNYLDTMAFSKKGLIDQLSSEYGDGYEKADATFAVETLEKEGLVDWNEQAEKAAKNYLETMSFSKDGLIEQLESEYGDQFTHEQAVHGADVAYK